MVACLRYHRGGASSAHRNAAHFISLLGVLPFSLWPPFLVVAFSFLLSWRHFQYLTIFRTALWLKQYGTHVSILCSFCILKASFLPRSCHIVPENQY